MTLRIQTAAIAAMLALSALSADAQGRGNGNGGGNGQGEVATGAGSGLPPSCFNANGLKEGRPECRLPGNEGPSFGGEDSGAPGETPPPDTVSAVPLQPTALMALGGMAALVAASRARRARRD